MLSFLNNARVYWEDFLQKDNHLVHANKYDSTLGQKNQHTFYYLFQK